MASYGRKYFDYCQNAIKAIFSYSCGVPKALPRDAILSNTLGLLKQARLRQNLSMNKLAERSGLHVSMISLMERGLRSPSLDVLLRVSEALEVDLWAILKEAAVQAKADKR